MAECPLCGRRRGKRACPARGDSICAQCCGSKRRIEIACPEGCVYLTGSHAGSWDGRETERRRDMLRVAPQLQRLSEDQSRLFFLALVGVNGIRASRRDLDDALLEQALRALRKTAETRSRGVLFEHQAEDVRAQGLLMDLRGIFEAKDAEGRSTAPPDSDLVPVLLALEQAVADTVKERLGATAFLDTAARLVGRFAEQDRAPRPARPLIVEP